MKNKALIVAGIITASTVALAVGGLIATTQVNWGKLNLPFGTVRIEGQEGKALVYKNSEVSREGTKRYVWADVSESGRVTNSARFTVDCSRHSTKTLSGKNGFGAQISKSEAEAEEEFIEIGSLISEMYTNLCGEATASALQVKLDLEAEKQHKLAQTLAEIKAKSEQLERDFPRPVEASTYTTSDSNSTRQVQSEVTETDSTSMDPIEASAGYRSTCGDPYDPNGTYWPVFIDGGNLSEVRANICGDAQQTIRKDTGASSVQVASFTSYEHAIAFADRIGGSVGQPTSYLNGKAVKKG